MQSSLCRYFDTANKKCIETEGAEILRKNVSCHMNQRLFIVFVFVSLMQSLPAQSIELFDASNQLTAGDTIRLDVSIEDYDIKVPIGITNVSGSSHPINVTRYEVDVVPNTSSFFCWGSCTGVNAAGFVPIFTPSGSVNVGAGVTIPADENGFLFHYDPNFQAGTSLFRFKFFDVNTPSDSAEMYVSIRSMDFTGLKDENLNQTFYPNPVNQLLTLTIDAAELYDLSGRMVVILQKGTNDLSKLGEGNYLLRSGKTVQHLIIQH